MVEGEIGELAEMFMRGQRLQERYYKVLLSLQIEEIVEGILERLNSQLEPSTKEETLQAIGSLAGSNIHTVVLMLLNKPLPWEIFTAMLATSERDLMWDITGRNIKKFMDALQVAGEVSADNVLETLKLLEVKILNNKMSTALCQKVTDTIITYLKMLKPHGELEEMCTAVLMAVGSHFPGMIIVKLWDRPDLQSLPPRSLLVAVGKLNLYQGTITYIGATWNYILRLLRMAEEEEDMLVMCHVLSRLVVSARKHLDMGSKDGEERDITPETVSIKAYCTLRVLFNRWPLKNMKKCICQLLDALTLSGSGGVNLLSQIENVTDMLFKLVSEKITNTDPHSVQNHNVSLRAFSLLTKLYNDQMVSLIRKTMESKDPARVMSALQVFRDVFHVVSQTEKLQSEVINSVIIVIQEDFKPVRRALLNFIETLSQYDYLTLSQGNVVIDYLIKLSQSNSSNEEDIRIMCFKILQMVSLPILITLVCHPSNILAFVTLSKAATEIALKARTLGQVPYLSNFHLMPDQVVSPQKLLTYLVLLSLKPYREKEFGVSSLRLLYALHPITSLHPVINSDVGQVWKKEIPQMLRILDGRSLVAINDDDWLEKLAKTILEKINYFNDDEEKAFLYKFFGFTLRTSRNLQLVKTMLSSILNSAHEELQEREGIAVALGIVSLGHLKITLDELKEYSTTLMDQDTSSILKLMKEYQQREWGLVCSTIYLSYGKIISESKGAIFHHLDTILASVLQHYHNCIVEKDNNVKVDFLNALSRVTVILSNLSITLQHDIPQKIEIISFMVWLHLCFILDLRNFKPLLEPENTVEVLQTCFKSVLSLPSSSVIRKEASSPKEGQASVELFRETLQSLRRVMEALVTEKATQIHICLQVLNTWLNSLKDSERERAMWCAARILGFTAKMNNFEVEIQFTWLGCLVRLLAIRCQDPVDNICFLSAQAVYNLYCILQQQKQVTRKKQGLWEEEDKNEVYSANIFYNNTYRIAKAFAEYFTQIQLTNLVLTAVNDLTDSESKVSLAAAQLMSAVMKERGRDMLKIEEIVECILEQLNSQLEPSTKEETLQAMSSLAGSNTHTVVPMLLNKPLPWDRTQLALWKAFGTQRETTINVLQLLMGMLEKTYAREERKEMSFQPVAVACALCEMLSETICQEAVQELYPRLLLSVLCHLYWVIEQRSPQKMVVYTKEGSPGGKSKPFDPTGCALEVVKLVFKAAAYDEVVVYASEHQCWELLSSPKSYYIGIMDLTSGIVKNCEPFILHRIVSHVRNLLYSSDDHQKVMARTFYVQLLWHSSVAKIIGQDFVGDLIRWIKEPNLIMKEIGLRGISNLALHPGNSEILQSLVPLLRDLLNNEVRVAVQAVKTLRNIIYHGQGEDTKVVFCNISRQLRQLINDACGGTLTEWTHVLGWSSLTETFRHTTLSDHIQVVGETCKFLVSLYELSVESAGVGGVGMMESAGSVDKALECVKNDPRDAIKVIANAILKKIDEDVKIQGSYASRLSQISSNFLRGFGIKTRKRKKHLFRTVKREIDIDENH
ncbi:maestro heat-like repeat-containing protein family member 1 [Marmota flaviventris]|uniref:maestro heat-like repeat-containing protein family member 1 n=1 Tax=Marmota flaviventris TaxID=93162 RepID=UPI003A887903